MTLEKAMELLPKEKSTTGRIDYYSAEGLLSKVYLTKAGVSGSLNQDDLKKAAEYSKDVIENSGRGLMEHYEDIFRGSNQFCEEILIASEVQVRESLLQTVLLYLAQRATWLQKVSMRMVTAGAVGAVHQLI